MASLFIKCLLITASLQITLSAPSVVLKNAAYPGTMMPVIGLGTGGYSSAKSSEAHPEHWNETEGFENSIKWFKNGGIRWDTALSYESQPGVAAGLLNATNNWTTTPRSNVFITSKTGTCSGDGLHCLGYNDTINAIEYTLNLFNTSYIDVILIHWPSENNTRTYASSDPHCNANPNNKEYSPSACRQSTWKALEFVFNEGKAKAIGVSNFEQKHLMDIFNLNGLLPAVNQFEFHGYWHEFELVEFCQSHDITVNAYAPLGTPDITYGYWDPVLTQHPVARNIGEKYTKSAAQVWLRWTWQQGIVSNPRSWNDTHQRENLDIFDFELSQNEMLQLADLSPDGGVYNKVCPDPSYFN